MPRNVFSEKIEEHGIAIKQQTLDKIIKKFETEIDGEQFVNYRKAIDLIYAVKRSGIRLKLSKLNLNQMDSNKQNPSVFDKDPYQLTQAKMSLQSKLMS